MNINHPAAFKQRGFTIVELLIVIVVIAVLAAITIVAYNEIQTRSKNAKTTSAVNQAIKLLGSYKALNGSYPTSGILYACIGEYAANTCQYDATGNPEVQTSAAFKTAIATVGTMPQADTTMSDIGTGGRIGGGAYYRADILQVTYYIIGLNKTCDAGGTAANLGVTTRCSYVLP